MSRMLNPQNFFKIFKPFRYGVPIMSEKMYQNYRVNRQMAHAIVDIKDKSTPRGDKEIEKKASDNTDSKKDSNGTNSGGDDREVKPISLAVG